jgi:hypothetical protein
MMRIVKLNALFTIDEKGLFGLNRSMLTYCPVCKEDALVVSESIYEGFVKSGDQSRCAQCGHEFRSAVKQKTRADPLAALFGEQKDEETPALFDVETETGRLCRRCTHYVLHPFTQRCGLHDYEVSATDTCDQFEQKLL